MIPDPSESISTGEEGCPPSGATGRHRSRRHAHWACLLAITVALGVAPRAAAQAQPTPARATSTAVPAAAATAAPASTSTPAAAPKSKSKEEVHTERVEKLRKLASDLQAMCALDEPRWAAKTADIKARVARDLGSRLVKARANVSALEDALKRSKTERRKLDDEKKRLSADPDKNKDRLAQIEREIHALNAFVSIDSRQLDQARKGVDDLAALVTDLDSSHGELAKRLDRTEICGALCDSVAADRTVTAATTVNLCGFHEAVPATAAVLVDWESVDALAEHAGGARKAVRERFGIDLPELPEDPFPETQGAKGKAPVSRSSAETAGKTAPRPAGTTTSTPAAGSPLPTTTAQPGPAPKSVSSDEGAPPAASARPGPRSVSSDEDVLPAATAHLAPTAQPAPATTANKGTPPARTPAPPGCEGRVSSPEKGGRESALIAPLLSGVGGLNLSATAAQTAEVALAALAKVIEDRAKRESLVWFLEKMQTHVCGDDEVIDKDLKELGKLSAELTTACQQEYELSIAYVGATATRSAAETTGSTGDESLGEKKKILEKAQEALEKARETREEKRAAFDAKTAALEALREVRTFWLPTTCALAKNRMDYVQYGGGASLVRALQGAVATDVRSWPGIAAGLGAGAAYWTTAAGSTGRPGNRPLKDLFACDPSTRKSTGTTDSLLCEATVGVRRATATFVGQVQGGANALSALYLYGAELDRVNFKGAEKAPYHHEPFQVAACLMSLPHVLQSFGDQARATTTEPKDEIEALLLAGLSGAPACWRITGEGLDRDECPLLGGKDSTGKGCTARKKQVDSPQARLERLSTLLRWYVKADPATERTIAQWKVVEAAWKSYLTAVRQDGGGAPFVPPSLEAPGPSGKPPTLEEVFVAFEAHLQKTARSAQETQQVKLLQAAASLARASLDFGVVLTDGLGTIRSAALYPGLRVTLASEAFQTTSKRLAEYARFVGTAELALTQNWGAAVANVVATTRAVVEAGCKEDRQCKDLMDRLSRYSGLFSALVSEKDPEKVAQALDAAAMPIGGWRLKQIEGAYTVSLTAFPGFGTALEKRWGQYGASRENGADNYWAAPTLQLPFGVDVAFGYGSGSSGLFVSMIDPAAYLHYDPDKQGRLPGAQLLTALAPGLALHQSIGRSPFVVTGYMVARPNFRAWESDVASPGATALQIGASLAVDVTLFELVSGRLHP